MWRSVPEGDFLRGVSRGGPRSHPLVYLLVWRSSARMSAPTRCPRLHRQFAPVTHTLRQLSFQIPFHAPRGPVRATPQPFEQEVHDAFIQSAWRTRLADPFVFDGLSDRDVGTLRLLRHGRAARAVHDRQAATSPTATRRSRGAHSRRWCMRRRRSAAGSATRFSARAAR